MTSAQPAWLAWPETHAAALLNHPAPLAAALAAVALAVYLPPRAARPALILAIALSATLWLAQDLGGLLTGTATDPNSAPLLALLAVSFWPAAREA
jgi:4-hydroxybenzoate polyprenyltransferase